LHHYGSSLNGKPLLRAYEINPNDYYTLSVGIGALTGVLTNIQLTGATSMGFHADPALLKHDPFDADYGCALYGHVTSSSSYFVQHPDLGSVCYLCDHGLDVHKIWIKPLDSLRRRVYIEPIGTSIEVDAGQIEHVVLDVETQKLNFTLMKSEGLFSTHRVKIVHWALCDMRPGCGAKIIEPKVTFVRGAWTFPATSGMSSTVVVSWSSEKETAIEPDIAME